MNSNHIQLLVEIKRYEKKKNSSKLSDTYSGSHHVHYFVSSAELGLIAKKWTKKLEEMPPRDVRNTLTSLFHGDSYEEKVMGGKILGYSKKLREKITPDLLDKWLEQLQGWAEIDSLCQSIFTADDILGNWDTWKKQLLLFVKSTAVTKKRASLVLLTGPVRKSGDKRLSDLAFANIQTLQMEKDILITKAISWLLRDLIKYNRTEVERFLAIHHNSLPKVAIRETKRKLLTGRK